MPWKSCGKGGLTLTDKNSADIQSGGCQLLSNIDIFQMMLRGGGGGQGRSKYEPSGDEMSTEL